MKRLLLVAAFGVALSGCTATRTVEVQPPAPPVKPAPPKLQALVQPGPWRIRKTEWTAADEAGFGQFVRAIAESGCTDTVSCMQGPANPFRNSDPPDFAIHADCAKWVYMLRAYYASKFGLPFSYVSQIASDDADPRYSATSNRAIARRDIIDTGNGIDTASMLKRLHDEVFSGTYRMDPAAQTPVQQDFYSPKIAPGSVHAGTAVYDINGHVMIVYEITPDGTIRYMSANPDQSVTRGAYGPHVPQSRPALGSGFKNFRPLKLEGAFRLPDGTYIGGHMVLAANDAISDYSLEQYRGNVADADQTNSGAQFRYNGASLNLYEYARASMSRGGFAFNPVYELDVSMRALCQEAAAGGRGADARIENGVATLYGDLSKAIDAYKQRDLRVVYSGLSLKGALAKAYAAQSRACIAATKDGTSPLDPFLHRSAGTDIQGLIAGIVEPASFAQMQPVGH